MNADSDMSKRAGTLASITAAIEATRTEIESVRIRSGADTYEAQVRLAIPLDGVTGLDRARIDTDHARFASDRVELDLAIEIDGSERERDISESISEEHAGASSGPDEAAPMPDSRTQQTGSDPGSEGTNDSGDRGGTPRYRDPERLAAVYDEDATFEEMRAALGVDVTAQTVRKYMIEHGIHEPEPRADRLLETIRASDLDPVSSEDDRSGETTRSTEPDADS